MPSLPTGKPSLICCTHFLFLFLFASSHVRGASLRQRGSESQRGGGGGDFLQSPNDDMLKALEFIESLRQRSGTRTGYEADDAEKLRAMLRLAPKEEEEEEEEEEEDEGRENKSEELLQAVLSTLQETEKASKQTPLRPRVQQHGIKPHRKMPLMFEDEEEGEGDEEEEGEEGPAPFKRTNENVEEKYTPQNLATLQSVFDELDKMTSVKTKRQQEEEEEEDEGEDVFNVRNVAYDNVGGDLADWGEGEEEEEGRGVDYDQEADDEEEEKYPVKRSKDTDEVANLVDYYLLKVLERTEEEEHKREIEEEEKKREEEEKKKRDTMDPRTIYQLIQISQKYQIPPEDLVDMLSTGETTKPRKPSPVPPKKTHKSPEGTFFNTRVPERRKTPEERRTEEILSILGLGGVEDKTPARKESSSSAPPPPSRFHTLAEPPASQRRRLPPGTLQDDYDDTLDEDELAAYLAAQMLARYPVNKHRNNKVSPTREEQRGAGSFEQNIQAYFDQMEEETKEKRHTEDEEDEDKTKGFDNEAVMKLMSYLNPDTDERESDATTEQEK